MDRTFRLAEYLRELRKEESDEYVIESLDLWFEILGELSKHGGQDTSQLQYNINWSISQAGLNFVWERYLVEKKLKIKKSRKDLQDATKEKSA